MEVVHEEDVYHHELFRIYHSNSDFHLKGILHHKMTIFLPIIQLIHLQ